MVLIPRNLVLIKQSFNRECFMLKIAGSYFLVHFVNVLDRVAWSSTFLAATACIFEILDTLVKAMADRAGIILELHLFWTTLSFSTSFFV